MVSEIPINVGFILDVKNFVELEAEICMRELKFKFLNRSFPVFPVLKEMNKHKERRYVDIEAPFLGEISGLGIIKLLGLNTYDILAMKIKTKRNKVFLEVANDSIQVIVLDSKIAIAILDIRSLGYHRIQQGVLHQRLYKYHSFESLKTYLKDAVILEICCKKKLLSQLILIPGQNQRMKMTNRQIIEKTADLTQSYLSKEQEEEV